MNEASWRASRGAENPQQLLRGPADRSGHFAVLVQVFAEVARLLARFGYADGGAAGLGEHLDPGVVSTQRGQ
ncbi:hypothetical protein OIE62_39205 [Streptomyces scopuliridis]|uniref:Uncharacterized protein n=1 Tax=Streptomyces scopuliridis TaxID=452529 RepID=A0ACD4ZCY3_9ACTN|nr:hypothetical protein [Streptomyces scopuliridis]WSB31613.1 hypothetical protein OG949_01110 [Streptomyces scopuliridis]WSB95861.1 hypothetical protein OG835_01720 [Streptomyces scopuliridis]WSC10432.1 hypothetical protein OIE62_39205 [Streptomyces scopuliridis]